MAERHRLRTIFESLSFQVDEAPRRPSPEETAVALTALAEVRAGLERRDTAVLELARRLDRSFADALLFEKLADAGPTHELQIDELMRRLEAEVVRGRLRVEREQLPTPKPRPDSAIPELPPLPPAPRERAETFFEVRWVDETGQAISGLHVEFDCDRKLQEATTNAAGVSLLEGVLSSQATVAAHEAEALEALLDPRWTQFRPPKAKRESNTTELVFRGDPLGPIPVKAVVPNTVLIAPPRGRLFVELFDKTGRTRHQNCRYTIDGPESFAGTTDELGCLLHEQVFPGDYRLTLEVDVFDGADQVTDVYTTPLVVLPLNASEPERRMIGAVPFVSLARLHFFFNTNKTFVLPTALHAFRGIRKTLLENTPCKLLVVGHADTAGGEGFNEQLSLERAKSTIAFLKDDVDTWLGFYDSGVPDKKRWGKAEDRMMLISMPGFGAKPRGEDAVRWFQRTRGLEVDGKAGPLTRRALVAEYLKLDGASLEEAGIEIETTAHGCGEHFPLDEGGQSLDTAPEDGKRDPGDRRAELFFFDPEFGIVPAPPGPSSKAGSTQYPEWRKRARVIQDFTAGEVSGPKVRFVELADTHFRTNSAVVLPEGERPVSDVDDAARPTSASALATALRFNQENPGKKLFVAGHTDTAASEDFNQKLSTERARCTLSLLTGGKQGRDEFAALCHARHRVADYKQFLAWVTRAFPDLAFDCAPGAIDDVEATGVEPVKRFQRRYNVHREKLNESADPLVDDGDVGPLTWGAFFDCAELSLQRELGVDAAGLAELRTKLEFVDDARRALGFSEFFPVEELGVDDFRSELNRRAEILFFDSGEEPDLADAEGDPETAELYLPGHFVRSPIPVPATSPSRLLLKLRVLDADRDPLPNADVRVQQGNLRFESVSDSLGFVEVEARRAPVILVVEWKAADLPEGEAPFRIEFFPAPGTGEQGGFERLHNLGYSVEPTLRERVLAFQREFERKETGDFADVEAEIVAWHDGGSKPKPGSSAAA